VAAAPDGKPVGSEPVSFTRPAAVRIARAVRKIEQGDRKDSPLSFGVRLQTLPQRVFRMGSLSGEWLNGSTATITLLNTAAQPSTVAAINLLSSVPEGCDTNASRNVAIAREGTQWYYVNHERDCEERFPAKELDGEEATCDTNTDDIEEGNGIQVLLNEEGCARWWKVYRQEIVTDVRWEDGIVVDKGFAWVIKDPDGTTSNIIVSAITCDELEEE
jgi:hypothetical protein